ncbi:hypothetical protein [Salisaeta icosahedral phage 1]|uniref:hypothetical protein n=1 Tax=Salisaeta icosahedral phage 1 TaxID=1183239 RepID=UPI00025EA930|nr:hypothetical protein A322_gp35 [Salisaeta icosahedral phage 1]AFJ21490.1 hypothetical protein [Salisaeta icosahedral phage 1]
MRTTGTHGTHNDGLAAPRISDMDTVLVSVTGADPSGWMDLRVRTDSYLFMCASYRFLVVGAQSGKLYGAGSTESAMGVDCEQSFRVPLEGFNGGEQVVIAVFDADWSLEAIMRNGVRLSEAEIVSEPFPLLPTQEGRRRGYYDPPKEGWSDIIDDTVDDYKNVTASTTNLVRWLSIAGVGVVGLYVVGPMLPVVRDLMPDKLLQNASQDTQ